MTTNATVQFSPASVSLRDRLRHRLERDATSPVLRVVVSPLHLPVELSGVDLLNKATDLARKFPQSAPGQVTLLLVPHSVELFLLQLGLVLEGRIPAILPWPTGRVDPEKYQRNLIHQLRNLPAHCLITTPALASNLEGCIPYPVVGCPVGAPFALGGNSFKLPTQLGGCDPLSFRLPEVAIPDEALFLQFSGGTTGAQKAVVVTAPMLEAQLQRLADTLSFTTSDTVVSWLPLYHDMGLIACLWFPLLCGGCSIHFSASDWLLNPGLLFRYATDYQASFCWLPNFAFSYLAAQRDRMSGPFDLSSVRGWINCSEPVRLSSITSFSTRFDDWGVSPASIQASYAMAENVFAVTQTPIGKQVNTFPRRSLAAAPSTAVSAGFQLLDDVYVSSGVPLDGMQIRIVDEKGQPCCVAQPGTIQLRTESLFDGYWTRDGFDGSAINGGWYSTGDYGFIANGELFVIGRQKDIIIVAGQNVFPEDAELLINSIEGVYAGRVVAFGVPNVALGTESLAVVAEMRGDFDRSRADALEREIRKLILSAIGISPQYAAVVPERWIVKSTAGKISRKDTRDRFLREFFGHTSTQ